jgi:hypothetical protein
MSKRDEDLEKFIQHFPQGADLTLQILKGHLLVEEILRELFTMQMIHSETLNGSGGTSFNCHQIICLVEAITTYSQGIPWVWVAAKKLNKIRNSLAHQLSPHGLEDKVNDFIKYVKENNAELDDVAKEEQFTKDHDLILCILSMCSCLSSLKPIITKDLIERYENA